MEMQVLVELIPYLRHHRPEQILIKLILERLINIKINNQPEVAFQVCELLGHHNSFPIL